MAKLPLYAQKYEGRLLHIFCRGKCASNTYHRVEGDMFDSKNPDQPWENCDAYSLRCGYHAFDYYNWPRRTW